MRQRGFSLLELMVVCMVITLLICIAVPSPAVTRRLVNQHQARTRVLQVGNIITAFKACSSQVPAQDCSAISGLIPASGATNAVTNIGYSYVLISVPSTPGVPAQSVQCDPNLYGNPTGLPRCSTVAPGWSCVTSGYISGDPWDTCTSAGVAPTNGSSTFLATPLTPADGTFGYVISDDTVLRCQLASQLSPGVNAATVPPCQ
jgi:prepilin-type N-terminal cleavage/methylation domain-containing protein